eukprot:gene12613-6518_t
MSEIVPHTHVKLVRIHKSLQHRKSWVEEMIEKKSNLFQKLQTEFNPTISYPIRDSIIQNQIIKKFLQDSIFEMMNQSKTKNDKFKVEISNIIEHIFQRIPIDPSCFVTSLMYFKKLYSRTNEINEVNFKKYFSSCVMISSKVWEDKIYDNLKYLNEFDLNDISLKEWNKIEIEILNTLKYELYISHEDFHQFIKNISKELSEKIINELSVEKFSTINVPIQ